MTRLGSITLAVLLICAIAAATPALAQAPADSATRDLKQLVLTLQHQLDALNDTSDPASRQRLMEQSWQGMQNYMGWMHDTWGVGYPWMMGYEGMGCPMMGGGAAAWPLPQGMSPTLYSQEMRDYMQLMRQQMSGITQSADSQERRRLMQEHWQSTYQHMQTMRGMGWMWAGPMGPGMMWKPVPGVGAAKPLPEAGSRGAALVATYCTQCHAAPSPTLHTATEWAGVTSRMRLHMSSLPGIRTPSEEEMRLILTYMQQHARS